MSLGFTSFILADPALMEYLNEQKIICEIHLSGEIGEVNQPNAFCLSKVSGSAPDLSPEE